MLDERPKPRGPILFGRALLQQQENERKAREDQQNAREFQVREQRMERQNAEANKMRAQAIELQQQALELRQQSQAVEIARTKAVLDASRLKLDMQKRAWEQFPKAATEIGKLDPKSADYDERIAGIKAALPEAFTVDTDTTKALDDLIGSKSKAREMWMKSEETIAGEQRKREEESQKAKLALDLGLAPDSASVGGFTFKKLDQPQVFPSFDAAKAKYPNATLRGTVDQGGKFTVEGIGSSASSDDTGLLPSVPAAPMGEKPVNTARPALSDIFK